MLGCNRCKISEYKKWLLVAPETRSELYVIVEQIEGTVLHNCSLILSVSVLTYFDKLGFISFSMHLG